MIPTKQGRDSGTGGGGQCSAGGVTPYFCKRCGRTVGRRSVRKTVDVCQKCRVRK